MAALRPALALAALLVAACGAPSPAAAQERPLLLEAHADSLLALAQRDAASAFDAYAGLMGRQYEAAESQRRAEIFAANVRKIAEHNARGDASYKLGINAYADWTTEEFGQR